MWIDPLKMIIVPFRNLSIVSTHLTLLLKKKLYTTSCSLLIFQKKCPFRKCDLSLKAPDEQLVDFNLKKKILLTKEDPRLVNLRAIWACGAHWWPANAILFCLSSRVTVRNPSIVRQKGRAKIQTTDLPDLKTAWKFSTPTNHDPGSSCSAPCHRTLEAIDQFL